MSDVLLANFLSPIVLAFGMGMPLAHGTPGALVGTWAGLSVGGATVLAAMAASGYTLSDARGKGARGRRTGELPGENVRIETLTGEETAARILDLLAER